MKKTKLEEIRMALGEEYEVEEISVTKNNGIIFNGVSVFSGKSPEGKARVGMQIYLDDVPKDEWADYVVKAVKHGLENKPKFDVSSLTSLLKEKDLLLSRVYPVLVNRELNNSLGGVIKREFYSLDIVYKLTIDTAGEGIGTITVDENLLNYSGVTVDELHKSAISNIQGKSLVGEPMSLVACNIMNNFDNLQVGELMNIITNKDRHYGSGMIFDEQALETIDKAFDGKDFYLLPSSVDEMIAVPCFGRDGEIESLREIVEEINGTEVPREKFLSNSIFICKDGEIKEVVS